MGSLKKTGVANLNFSLSPMGSLIMTRTLFIFLAQFLVTTKIKAKKLVVTKNFGSDQFFCLIFGRDQKLGEEDEKG